MRPNIFGNFCIRGGVIQRGIRLKQPQRINNLLHAGRAGEREQIIYVVLVRNWRRGRRFDGRAANTQVPQSEILKERDERFIGRAEQMLARFSCGQFPHAKAQAGKVFWNCGAGSV